MDGSAGAAPKPVLEVNDLETIFHTRDGAVHAVNGVSFQIGEGELRADRAKREEHEKAKQIAYMEAQKAAQKLYEKEAHALTAEVQQREEDYKQGLKDQEDRGLIRMNG